MLFVSWAHELPRVDSRWHRQPFIYSPGRMRRSRLSQTTASSKKANHDRGLLWSAWLVIILSWFWCEGIACVAAGASVVSVGLELPRCPVRRGFLGGFLTLGVTFWGVLISSGVFHTAAFHEASVAVVFLSLMGLMGFFCCISKNTNSCCFEQIRFISRSFFRACCDASWIYVTVTAAASSRSLDEAAEQVKSSCTRRSTRGWLRIHTDRHHVPVNLTVFPLQDTGKGCLSADCWNTLSACVLFLRASLWFCFDHSGQQSNTREAVRNGQMTMTQSGNLKWRRRWRAAAA